MTTVFGEKLKIEIYGKSHGPQIGVRMSGVPDGFVIDMDNLQAFLNRRAPGRNPWSTPRKEADSPMFLSGIDIAPDPEATGVSVYVTTGETIEAVIKNTNVRPQDYENTAQIPRPGHADYPAWVKYGTIESGGGPFSARLTAPLCIAGGICLQWLAQKGIEIKAHIYSVGGITDAGITPHSSVLTYFPVIDQETGDEIRELIEGVKQEGDSIGGSIECMITGLPAGIGEPIFGSIESRICQSVFAVPAVKGIEFGAGFRVSEMRGSENNDPFDIVSDEERGEAVRVITETNHHGGILGGLSSGMPVVFRVAMKPTPSIAKVQDSVDLELMEPAKLQVRGRHDPCIVPRAVPCIEAAAAIAICDMLFEEGMM